MSFQTVYHEVSVDKDQLLQLFLGQGVLPIRLAEQNITINEFNDRHVLRFKDGIKLHTFKIRGGSYNEDVDYVDGTGTLSTIDDNETFQCSLELHLQDLYD